MIPYTAIATALLALLFIGLSSAVSRLRLKHGISLGDGGNRDLSRAIRAHGNLAEFAPMFLLLVLALELQAAGGLLLGALVAIFVGARYAHGLALLFKASSLARQVGAGLSYLAIAFAACWLMITLFF